MSAWTQAWARATLIPAARRATPVFAGVAIVGGVVFGPNGMRPRDVVVACRAEPVVGAVLAIAWALLVAPVGHALWRSPGTSYLRSLPAPRGGRTAIAVAGAIAVQAPWIWLWGRGAGPLGGAIAGAFGAGVTLAAGLWPGWRDRRRVPRWRSATTAATAAIAIGLGRTAGAALVRGAGLVVLAGAAAGGMVRVNALAGGDALVYSGAIIATLVAIALAGPIGAVAELERRFEWLARSTGLGVGAPVALVLGGAGAIAGAGAGAIAAWIGGAPEVIAGAIAVGLALGFAGAWIASWAREDGDVDGTRVAVGIAGVAFALVASLGVLGPLALVAAAAGGGAAALAGAERRRIVRG